MASIALDPAYRRVTVAEFLDMDFGGARAELDDGLIYMMAGTPERALVAARIIRRLGNGLDGTGCEPVGSDMGLKTSDRTLRYPDRSDPVVVIEVLSPSTAEHDHKVKLLEYQTLAGVRQVLLIDPASGATRVVTRKDDDEWSDRWLRGDEPIEIVPFGIEFSRSEIGIVTVA